MYQKLNLQSGEGYLLTDKLYRKYFSGIDVDEGYLLISDTVTYFIDARYFSAVKEKLDGSPIKCALFENIDSIKRQIQAQNLTTIYLDYESTTLAQNEIYQTFNVWLKNGTDNLQKVRQIKNDFEIQSIEKACEIIQKVVNSVPNIVRPNITEKEIADYIEKQVILEGAEGLSFDTIVAFGKHAAVPHHQTGDTPLKENECILIDTGCVVNGYCSDITRTYFYGKPQEKFITCYNAVKESNQIAFDSIEKGSKLFDADNIARQYLDKFRLKEYFTHSLGHGVGLAIHEQPYLSKKATGVFEENMVFTIEPGVYFDGEFGIRIEDTVAIKDGKPKRLYSDSKELIVIQPK